MRQRILCYGDSDTWGTIAGSGDRREARWTVVCQQFLGDDYVILEDGLSGRTTAFDHPANPWMNGLKGLGYALMSQRPLDAVVLFLGANDVIYTDAEGSVQGAELLVRAILDADAFCGCKRPVFPNGVKLLLISTPLSHPDIAKVRPGTAVAENAPQLEKYGALYGGLAKKWGIDFLDAKLYAECSPVDCVHMTGESHQRLGKAVAEKLLTMFKMEK